MCSFFSKSDLAAEIEQINEIVEEKVKVVEKNCQEREETNKDELEKMAGNLKEVEQVAEKKHSAFSNLIEDLKEKLRNTMTEHKLWEDKVDKIIKSSDSEKTKERERQKILELIGKVDKSENEFDVFREMFQQVFQKQMCFVLDAFKVILQRVLASTTNDTCFAWTVCLYLHIFYDIR